jgi:hypothetical protein
MPRGYAGIYSWGGVGKSHVVHDAHLFILQSHTSSFGASQLGKMAPIFSVWPGIGKHSTSQESRMLESLILIDAMS